jgi:ubiquinone biosynthesis protein
VGVYHADPHRGNVLLADDGRLALLDFGLVGRLADDVRRRLGLLLLALAGIETGAALADLQRVALRFRILLPTSFALVGKTLAQADSIARTLDPQLDPVELVEGDTLNVIVGDIGRSLEPNRVLSSTFTQLESLARLPSQVGEIATKLELGTLKVGVAPKDLGDLDKLMRSTANRVGVSLIVVGLLVSSALMARVNDAVALAGFAVSGAIALYLIWKILRTPGEI